MEKRIVKVFFFWRLYLMLIVALASLVLPATGEFTPYPIMRRGLPYWVWAWANFDGVHYVTIAQSGYFFNLQPFFPLYPFAIRLTNELMGFYRLLNGYIISGQIVSSAAFLVSLFLIVQLIKIEKRADVTNWVLAAMFVFPTSFFYTAVYNDALFLFFASLTILWGRQRRWVLASAAGALATLTRLNGLALVFFILIEYGGLGWRIREWGGALKRLFSWKTIPGSGILLIPAAFFGYLLYVQQFFTTYRWVFTSMRIWGQDRLTFPLQVVWRYLKIFYFTRPNTLIFWIAVSEFAFVLFHVTLLIYSWKKIRFSYWVFFAVSLLIPTLTGTFQGMPRYGLHLYPMFLVLGMWLKKHPVGRIGFFLISAGLQIIFLALFSRGWFVS